MAEEETEIFLYIYDMSKGLAKTFSAFLLGLFSLIFFYFLKNNLNFVFLGKEIPGIWHTAVVAFDREYFFGGMGIESCIVVCCVICCVCVQFIILEFFCREVQI